MIFLCILASSLEVFEFIFTFILWSRFHQKMHSKFHRFFDRFWEAFSCQNWWIFTNFGSHFLCFSWSLAKRPDPMNLLYVQTKSMVRVLKKGTKIEPKSHRKFDENWAGIFIDFGMILGGLWASFWLHKSIKNQGRILKDFWRIQGVGSAAEAGPGRTQFQKKSRI